MRSTRRIGVIAVRTGKGNVVDIGFDDVVDLISRVATHHGSWWSIKYKGKRYQLGGGIRTIYFICLNNPIGKRPKQAET